MIITYPSIYSAQSAGSSTQRGASRMRSHACSTVKGWTPSTAHGRSFLTQNPLPVGNAHVSPSTVHGLVPPLSQRVSKACAFLVGGVVAYQLIRARRKSLQRLPQALDERRVVFFRVHEGLPLAGAPLPSVANPEQLHDP